MYIKGNYYMYYIIIIS